MLDIIQSVYINSSFIWCKCLYILKQCTIILKLSLKDMCPYLNILFIWNLTRINFYVFHTRDLTLFLIHYQWGPFISHFLFFSIFSLFGIFLFLFLFHTTISFIFPYNHAGECDNAILWTCIFHLHSHSMIRLVFYYIVKKRFFENLESSLLFVILKKKKTK